MSGFVDKLKLKEKAEEDLYFARRDADLLAARRSVEGHDPPLPETGIRVVSGGQSGVDRAALDAAVALGLPIGGWCPLGRRAEDGPIPDRYPLHETPSADYAERTEWNVRDSAATLILHRGPMTGGTRLTVELARRLGKPLLARDLAEPIDVQAIVDWLVANRVHILNCAGPRESGAPGIGEESQRIFVEVFRAWPRLSAASGLVDASADA
ncbi:putative molybdenum carrier protein [Thiocapsa roseopersicina]|uniref:Putative molybdenum carrier n=1 Tax=Thiocapsa roseopersicina TaxID=1058 RepID=A0A1H3AJR8_THIRO|nr:putative molybdenum carrier protein [Thiocapsa roseopersicina]SDX29863.1 Putative molybdenum carrier [Thiocapsa roseopersicina]